MTGTRSKRRDKLQVTGDKSDLSLVTCRLSRFSGFTLIELVLAVIILAVLTSVTLPRFGRTYQHLQLEQAALRATSLMHYAGQKAVVEHRAHRVVFDGTHHTMQVTAEETPGVFVPVNGRWGQPYRLADEVELIDPPEAVLWRANGSAEPPAALTLHHRKTEEELRLQVDGLTGRVEVME